MAFTLDQATVVSNIGSTANTANYAVTTTGVVASGALIVLVTGWFQTNAATGSFTASGGGLTWTTAASIGVNTASSDGCAIVWAPAPSGLASGTSITFGGSLTNNAMSATCTEGTSFFGAAGAPSDGTATKATTTITGGNWSGNTIPGMTGSSDLVVAIGWGDGQSTGGVTTLSSVGTGWTAGPTSSQSNAVGGVATLLYAMNVASVPNPTNWGTWASNPPSDLTSVTAAFLASGGVVASPNRTLMGVGV